MRTCQRFVVSREGIITLERWNLSCFVSYYKLHVIGQYKI